MRLYHPDGRHIIEYNEPEELVAYRRTTVGFMARESNDGMVVQGDDPADGSFDCTCDCCGEAEDYEEPLILEPTSEEEEDEP